MFGSHITPYKFQKYDDLKKEAQISGKLFTDAEFPPEAKSIFSTGGDSAGIEWKRPGDLCADPKLFVEGVSGNDVSQGDLGNCWLVAATSCLAQDKDIWSKVIPDHKDQEWDAEKPENYAGIFKFNFWRYGEWVQVVVDDYLPCRGNKLVYVHSNNKNEFWSALLEKAYAKIFGCYEVLDGGELAEALEDFTGGIAEPVDLNEDDIKTNEEKKDELYKTMRKAADHGALMAAAIPAQNSSEMEQSIDVGLVKGHAYGITAIKRVALSGSGLFNIFNKEKLSMVRLRNPWGGTEWNGAFSDGSDEWKTIDKSSQEKIGLTFEDDGEFWMTFDDFVKYFQLVSICRVVNTSILSTQKTWHEGIKHGEWRSPGRSGGCINNRDTFLHNPQYVFDVTEDEDEILIGLTQKKRDRESDKLTIGFTVMKVEVNRKYRVHRIQEVVKSSVFKNSRSIFMRDTLKKGRYVLIANIFEAGPSSELLLRIYTSASNHFKELKLEKPDQGCLNTVFGCIPLCAYPKLVTKVRVIKAEGLENQDTTGGADPYIILKCEQEAYESPVVKDSQSPDFQGFGAIFFRKNPASNPIKIQVWNENPLRDTFMGQHILDSVQEVDEKVMTVTLVGRKTERGEAKPGKLQIQVTTSTDLTLL